MSKEWEKRCDYFRSSEKLGHLISMVMDNHLPDTKYPEFQPGQSLATRKAFGATLDEYATSIPNLIGGSADLEPSNYTGNFAKVYADFSSNNQSGRNIPFGVREFPMASMMNGMALHGGVIPFGGTFLVFSDYERPALRLGAIQNIRVLHEFTHDSFYVERMVQLTNLLNMLWHLEPSLALMFLDLQMQKKQLFAFEFP